MQKDFMGDDTWAPPKDKIPDNGYKRPAGYAAPPGTGPEGKHCRDCHHAMRRKLGKHRHVWKCLLAAGAYFRAVETDIAAKSPCCRLFQIRVPRPPS